MKEVTIIVTNETARHLESLIERGGTPSWEAFYLADHSRRIRGERWIKITDVGAEYGDWIRLPNTFTRGT